MNDHFVYEKCTFISNLMNSLAGEILFQLILFLNVQEKNAFYDGTMVILGYTNLMLV